MEYGIFEVPKEFLTLSEEQVAEYSADAERHYTSDYAYHNWDHAQAVVLGTEIIAKKLESRGVGIAKAALAIAAAWHDAGYHEDHVAKGYKTKELYSATLLDTYLVGKPVGDFEKDLMRRAIIATWGGYEEPRTPSELILHRADIANIGGPEDEFFKNSVKLWHEAQHTTRKKISWKDYVATAGQFIERTAAEHDHESRENRIDPLDTTIDVHDLPFAATARKNLQVL